MKWLKNNLNLLISIALMLMTLTVFGPVELFLTNSSEFWFDFWEMLKISGIMTAVLGSVLLLVGVLLKGKARSFYSALVFIVALCLYIQGNFLNIDYGILDGKSVDWSAFKGYAVADTLFWVAVIAILLVLWKKKEGLFKKIQMIVPSFIMAMQVLTLGVLLVSSNIFAPTEEGPHYLSTENLFNIGQEDNVVVFVLDAFDEAYMEELLETEPEKYKTILGDFTHFTNVAVGGATTNSAMPIVITGEHYPGELSYKDYVKECFNSDGLYTELVNNGYSVNIYTASEFVPAYATEYVDNLVADGYQASSYLGISQKYGSLTAYKYMPHLLKRFFWIYTGDFDQYKAGSANGMPAYTSDDAWFYETLATDKLTQIPGKTFHIIHTTGAHPPYNLNEYAQPAENVSIMEKSKGQMYIVDEYLRQMKELGVYDSSTVIIMSDHGQEILQRGLLLVKQPNATGFKENDAPVSHFDLHNTFFELLGKETGESIFDIEEDSDRIRMYYPQGNEAGSFYMTEYQIVGNPKDLGNCIATGTVFAPQKEEKNYNLGEELTFGADGTANQFAEEGIVSIAVAHSWTDGHEVLFRFPLDEAPKNDLSLALTYYTVYLDINDQYLGIYVDDVLLFEEVLTSTDSRTICLDIPAELAADKEVVLRLALPDAKCPLEVLGPGNDPHTLGLALTGLSIEEVDLSNVTPYTFGDFLSFGYEATVTEYAKEGVGTHDTEAFAWTTNKDVLFRIPFKYVPETDLTVSLNVSSVFTWFGPQQVQIFAGSTLCYDEVLEDDCDISFTVPKDALSNNALALKIHLPDAVSPYTLTGEGDHRVLGLALTGLSIDTVDGNVDGLQLYDHKAAADDEAGGFSLTKIIAIPLIVLMQKCYEALDDYILAIIVFTLLSKILLMPVALWMQRSSITMVEMMPELNQIKTKYFGDKETISEETQILYKKRKYNPLASTVPMIVQIVLLMGVIEAVKVLLGDSGSWLLWIPAEVGGLSLLMPVAAGIAALLLSLAQNKLAPLQKEQPKAEQLSTGLVSVGISLFLGAFVSLGTGVYWIASNLFSIPVQVVCNWIINPKKYVDYEALEASKKQLEQFESVGKKKKESYFSENKKKERDDYKRFFSVVNKHLVFYSESNGFYKYYKGFIEFILAHTNLTIHYITSDPNDQIFELEKKEPKIRGYYIGENKLITLMMKMDADVVVMTMPDLENYHIKRSYIRDDIEYVNVSHGMGSNNLTFRKGALDHFDSVFCAGVHQKIEIEQQEAVYNLPAKTCVKVGYPLIDDMRANYANSEHKVNVRKKILVAPSWQKDNIIDSCLEELLDALKKTDCEIIVRPHPQEVRLKKEYMDSLKAKYAVDGIEIQTDFTSNNPVMEADLLITDWSDISWEYAFTTLRPVMYINTPMKVMNPEWQKIEYPPLNIFLRDQLGKSLDVDQLDKAAETAEYLLANTDTYRERINELAHEYVYNLGTSAEAGAVYLIKAVLKQIEKKGTERNES